MRFFSAIFVFLIIMEVVSIKTFSKPSQYVSSIEKHNSEKWKYNACFYIEYRYDKNSQKISGSDSTNKNSKKLNCEIFLPGIISTDKVDTTPAFSPDGNTMFFSRREAPWFSDEPLLYTIYLSYLVNGKWQIPDTIDFSGKYSDRTPFVSPDGKRLYFSSNRPVQDKDRGYDIWYAEIDDNGFNELTNMGERVNSPQRESSPIITINGNLYFSSSRSGGYGSGDIYVSRLNNGKYDVPENLGPSINSKNGEWNVWVSPDEKYMIFESSGRKENLSYSGDLYLSVRTNNKWSEAVNLSQINSQGSDLLARLSPDCKTLYFTSSKNPTQNHTDVYMIDFKKLLKMID